VNEIERLPVLIRRAIATLESAKTAGEILDAKKLTDIAYTTAKLASRLRGAKNAHDTVLTACHKTMGDALIIESRAQVRLADEVDAAQKRGEMIGSHDGAKKRPSEAPIITLKDIGITKDKLHEARVVRNAEAKEPGIVRKTVEEKLQSAKEPTRADVKRATRAHSGRGKQRSKRRAASSGGRAQSAVAGAEVELPAVAMDNVAQILDLIERVQSKYGGDSPDIRALCAVARQLVAVRIRDARARGKAEALPHNGAGAADDARVAAS
jgi:hypothetical protein